MQLKIYDPITQLRVEQGDAVGRHHIADLLNKRKLTNNAVEIGTHRGVFAKQFLERWHGNILYCVDPYETLPDYADQVQFLADSNGDRARDYTAAIKTLHRCGHRVQFMRTTSEKAVANFENESLDFVYVDGNHKLPYCRQDIDLWWPKVKSGGILAGHDIIYPWAKEEENWGRHIQPAVFGFAVENDLTVYFVVETDGNPWSYYLEKP